MDVGVAPPGWYPDPLDGPGLRYWDGAVWTEHVHVAEPAPSRVETAPEPVPALALEPEPEATPAPVEGWILAASGGAMVLGSLVTGAKGKDALVFAALGLLVALAGVGLAQGKGRPNRRDIIVLLVAVLAAGLYGLSEVFA